MLEKRQIPCVPMKAKTKTYQGPLPILVGQQQVMIFPFSKNNFNTIFRKSYSAISFTEFCSYYLKWDFRSSWESKVYPLRYILINVSLKEKKIQNVVLTKPIYIINLLHDMECSELSKRIFF